MKNLVGQKFTRIIVLGRVASKKKGTYWQCICDCGTVWSVRGSALRDGCTKSCGCISKEMLIALNFKRRTGNPARKNGTIEYFKCNTWNNIRKRVINGKPHPRNAAYIRKGIRLDITKEEFYTWCESQRNIILSMYSQGITPSIDRINAEEHYCLGNIQIISHIENINRRHN